MYDNKILTIMVNFKTFPKAVSVLIYELYFSMSRVF